MRGVLNRQFYPDLYIKRQQNKNILKQQLARQIQQKSRFNKQNIQVYLQNKNQRSKSSINKSQAKPIKKKPLKIQDIKDRPLIADDQEYNIQNQIQIKDSPEVLKRQKTRLPNLQMTLAKRKKTQNDNQQKLPVIEKQKVQKFHQRNKSVQRFFNDNWKKPKRFILYDYILGLRK